MVPTRRKPTFPPIFPLNAVFYTRDESKPASFSISTIAAVKNFWKGGQGQLDEGRGGGEGRKKKEWKRKKRDVVEQFASKHPPLSFSFFFLSPFSFPSFPSPLSFHASIHFPPLCPQRVLRNDISLTGEIQFAFSTPVKWRIETPVNNAKTRIPLPLLDDYLYSICLISHRLISHLGRSSFVQILTFL